MKALILAVVCVAACAGCDDAPASEFYDPKGQPERQRLIDELIGGNVFTKVEAGGGEVGALYVGKVFEEATIDQKQSFVAMVYTYCVTANRKCDRLIIQDGYSGKRIGRFTPKAGLVLD